MRPTLATGLVDAVRTNFNRKSADLRLFEIGKVFEETNAGDESTLPAEREFLGIAVTGRERFENSAAPGRAYDFFDLKTAVEQAADAIGVPELRFEASDDISYFQPGQSALLKHGGVVVGTAGKLSGPIAAAYKFKQPVFVAEINLEFLLRQPDAVPVYTPLPLYPSVTRDVSLVVSDKTNFGEIAGLVGTGGYEFFEEVRYVDTYSGSGVRDDERAFTIRIEYRSDERTLTDDEVDAVHADVLRSLETDLHARFR